ncbi:MaoC family dehydratase [Ruegeria halocynthiae]|uniref:MaoC family dehydratase n=1 Tax=Ruegeria halocynthiae TaxID=985054 RepID=UPI00055ECB36|nr:MaoC family dehydratase [Ruegeria halocynthiae]
MSNLQDTFDHMTARIGQANTPSEWFTLDQARVDQFGAATLDDQWIHCDPDRARDGPFGQTIAHGQLTLSIMELLPLPADAVRFDDLDTIDLIINYGFNKVRFPSPVPVGARIRAHTVLQSVEIKGDMIEAVTEKTVEIENHNKPACVAIAIARYVVK